MKKTKQKKSGAVKTENLMVRIEPELKNYLFSYAKKKNMTVSEYLHNLIGKDIGGMKDKNVIKKNE